MTSSTKLADKILENALLLATESSWEKVRLQQIADASGINLEQVRQYYRQKDDLAEALFDRADQAMLTFSDNVEFKKLCGRDRLREAIMTWLRSLTPYRHTVIDIFKYKLEPGHIHFQTLGVLRVSRTVQWMLEASGSKTSHLSRIAEELGATSIYLAALVYWLRDRSADSRNTSDFIDRLLEKSEKLAGWINPGSIIRQPADQIE